MTGSCGEHLNQFGLGIFLSYRSLSGCCLLFRFYFSAVEVEASGRLESGLSTCYCTAPGLSAAHGMCLIEVDRQISLSLVSLMIKSCFVISIICAVS